MEGKKDLSKTEAEMARKAQALGLALFLVGSALAAWGQEKSPNRIVSEKLIGKFHPSGIPESLKVSPDGKRVAYVAVSRGFFTGNKWFVVVDGKEEKQYDNIGPPIFSPDSKRVGYGAKEGNKWFVVIDGKEEKQYDNIAKGTPIFSPGSKRVTYAAKEGNKWFVVVDAKEEKPYDGIWAGSLTFSPDSKRVAYWARVGNKLFVVIDGKEEKPYDAIGDGPIFSPDSKRVAYGAKEANKKWFLVVDGNEGKQYDSLLRGGKVIFDSSDAFHYLAEHAGEQIYLVEGTIR